MQLLLPVVEHTKACRTCGDVLPFAMFHKESRSLDGVRSICRKCHAEDNRRYVSLNREKVNNNRVLWVLRNPARIKYVKPTDRQKAMRKEWEKNNSVSLAAYKKVWAAQNIERLRERRKVTHKSRIGSDIDFRLRCLIRSRINTAINKGYKTSSSAVLLGCEISALRLHLEGKFKPGMSWDNHGVHGWHIDHIKPCASFDLSDPEQQKLCFHYSNLQPLWAKENLLKGTKH